MLILDLPYVSELLASWAEESQHPILRNEMTAHLEQQGYRLNTIDEAQAIERINEGEAVYTNSENALHWISTHTSNEVLNHAISTFKDKAKMREILRPLNPRFFFESHRLDELTDLDFDNLPCPFILKPAVGFGSMGVYVINNHADWQHALADIQDQSTVWNKRFPESVVDAHQFLLEAYITGTEYAVDAYFDQNGFAHILNIMRHDFANAEDTSDRLYSTNAAIFSEMFDSLQTWLTEVNQLVGAQNFPVHVELRKNEEGFYPIEFNPLRFAGFSSTDIAYYAYGIRTYEYFLTNATLDYQHIIAHVAETTSMSMLGIPEGENDQKAFDYDTFCSHFSNICEMRKLNAATFGTYGFLFFKTTEATASERDFVLNCDLRTFLPS